MPPAEAIQIPHALPSRSRPSHPNPFPTPSAFSRRRALRDFHLCHRTAHPLVLKFQTHGVEEGQPAMGEGTRRRRHQQSCPPHRLSEPLLFTKCCSTPQTALQHSCMGGNAVHHPRPFPVWQVPIPLTSWHSPHPQAPPGSCSLFPTGLEVRSPATSPCSSPETLPTSDTLTSSINGGAPPVGAPSGGC